jgi:glyceraldehyde dehydrogenase small subunit
MAGQAADSNISTVEGLSKNGSMSPLQEAFIDNFSFQCGFCTPGFLMSAAALLDENSAPSEEEIRDSLHGNICRCTGYLSIIDGVKDAAKRITEGGN